MRRAYQQYALRWKPGRQATPRLAQAAMKWPGSADAFSSKDHGNANNQEIKAAGVPQRLVYVYADIPIVIG